MGARSGQRRRPRPRGGVEVGRPAWVSLGGMTPAAQSQRRAVGAVHGDGQSTDAPEMRTSSATLGSSAAEKAANSSACPDRLVAELLHPPTHDARHRRHGRARGCLDGGKALLVG